MSTDEALEVEYKVHEPARDLREVAEKIAQEQSLGGYEYALHRGAGADEFAAEVVSLRWRDDIVGIRYPLENLSTEEPSFAHLLNYVAGDVFGSRYFERINVHDVRFPPSLAAAFGGPRFGIEGIRERAGVTEDRPMLGMILKPSLGLAPERIAELVGAGVRGGVDLIKEDEKLVDPAYCPFEERLDAVVGALRGAEAGEAPLYVLNVTDRLEAFTDYVAEHDVSDVLDRFVLLGTVVSLGFDRFAGLADHDLDADVDLPVYAHRAGHAAYTRTEHGIDMPVIETLSRLAGADFAHCGTVAGSHPREVEEVFSNHRALVRDWHGLAPTMPVVSGGVNPSNIGENAAQFQRDAADLVFMIGTGIYATTEGVSAPDARLEEVELGIRANRQAIEAAVEGVPVEDIESGQTRGYDAMYEWLVSVED